MNNINAARRNQEAATAQGEGDKTLRIKKAEGESESMRLLKEAMSLVALTQYMDTIRSVGEHGNMTTLLLPASPSAVGSLMDEVQQGMLRGNLAAGAAQIGGNGAHHPALPARGDARS